MAGLLGTSWDDPTPHGIRAFFVLLTSMLLLPDQKNRISRDESVSCSAKSLPSTSRFQKKHQVALFLNSCSLLYDFVRFGRRCKREDCRFDYLICCH